MAQNFKIICKKLKMTQLWKNETVIPVTVLKVDPVRSRPAKGSATGTLGRPASNGVESENKKLPEDIKEGTRIKISGKSKGKGFQGVVKRHGFHGGPKTHGQKDRLRAPGSLGPTAPQRTIKGRKMAGHMGQRRITAKNVEIVAVNSDDQTILVKGAVPGMRGSRVEIRNL